jgi:GxxExxY protein
MGAMTIEEMTYAIRGVLYNVYNDIGSGLPEKVYQECLVIEFSRNNVPFLAEPHIRLSYKNQALATTIRPDFICFDRIIIEIKTVAELEDRHLGQTISYLRCLDLKLGLLVNFGTYPDLHIMRVSNSRQNNTSLNFKSGSNHLIT